RYRKGFYSLFKTLQQNQNTNSYQAAILTAVNLGGDTDTTAAVTGALAGILYGGEVIPENWRKSLQNDQLLKTISQRFCDTVLSQRI
ncbi:TPA: ADP-ribosylglycohydrolase family protein, partial [Enterococcus faecium]|nr:ADP-ribosylglycohydrolase family protein [Enterococcus faecium]